MKFKLFILISLMLAASHGHAQDTVMLKNGDILTGKILEQTPDHVYFKSAAFGSISLRPHDIEEIRIVEENLGEIRIPEEAIAKNEETEGNLPKAETPEPPAAEPQPPKKKQWSGQAGLAIAMREKTSTNLSGAEKYEKFETYRLYGNVNWKGERNALRWDWTYRYSEDETKVRDDYFNVTQRYNHTFKNNDYFATAKTLYQRDHNRRIENEYLQTAELGIKWFGKDSKVQLSTSAGGGYHVYDRIDPTRTSSTSVSEPKFIFDEKFRWDIINTLALTQKYTHLGNLDNYHLVFSAGIENKLVKDIFLRLEYRLDRDTEVFYDDRGYYDKALLTSLLYKF